MHCELCGRECETVPALIEGAEMDVCPVCARHGQVLKKPIIAQKKEKISFDGPEKIIVKNYAGLIKKKREELGLSQEDFAKQLNEKLSTMQSIEAGHMKPTIPLAEKLKKRFGLELIEEVKNTFANSGKSGAEGFTIGDLIKKR